MEHIRIRGARTHNLKNVDLDLPRNKLIVITGLSGSGKSSLAFDTIYAEGQRRYVESLSSYARQFLAIMEKPDVDHIEGLSPAISIEQKTISHNPRSTVGTVTEIYDYLRLLFARAGEPRCPTHGLTLETQTVSQMVDHILDLPEGTRLLMLAPMAEGRKGEYVQGLAALRSQGFIRARIDGEVRELDEDLALDPQKRHTIEAVIDRFRVRPDIQQRLAESIETALHLSGAIVRISFMVFSARFACPHCGYSLPELEPRLFSFNNPVGACPGCDGIGVIEFFDPERVVRDAELSLAAGAVRGWDSRNTYYLQMLKALSRHYGFDIDMPYAQLPEVTRQVILYGSGEEEIEFQWPGETDKNAKRHYPFEGIIPNMQRRYRETESNIVREELAKYLSHKPCPECGGARLRTEARNVFVADHTLPEVTAMPIAAAQAFFSELRLAGRRGEIAKKIVHEIGQRLAFLVNVGLDYLTLERTANTLSGGETQRIRLASQIGAGLVGVMYVLDEPSIGLHQRDNHRLLDTLNYLRDLGNTVIVVEHDEDAIRAADHLVDIGPGAGVHGGRIIAQGTPAEVTAESRSITGQYLSGKRSIAVPERTVPYDSERVCRIRNARGNNLKRIDVEVPVGLMTCITGVSGSGKSTLINDTLYRYAAATLYDSHEEPAPCDEVAGLDLFDKVVNIDQSPIGRTPRSNPATYTGLFTPIRELYATTTEARTRGYSAGRFSFNVKGGRCEACKGDGVIKVEMHFLPDIYVPCDVCKGKRYNRETLEVTYKGKNIQEVLEMSVEEALTFFGAIPAVARKLKTLVDVGLSYVQLGQNATTLSGGEAQRVKLSRELSKRETGSTLYILDEPTTGLHFHDIQQLLHVLHRLRDQGNTIVVIEHNLDVIKTADWIIDLGPEGGDKGGEVLVCGTPREIASCPHSHTGHYLRAALERSGEAWDTRRAQISQA